MDLEFSTNIQYVPKVGPIMAKRLNFLGITTVEDLLYYIPFRYNDFSLTVPIASVTPGEIVTISATITSIANVRTKSGKYMQRATVSDNSKSIRVIWFNQPFLLQILKKNQLIHLSGKVDWFGRDIVITSPEYELPSENQGIHTGRIVPVYSVTEGISSKWLRGRIAYILDLMIPKLEDYLPLKLKTQYSLIPIQEAIAEIHFPSSLPKTLTAKHRLAFDELLLWNVRSRMDKKIWASTRKSRLLKISDRDKTKTIEALPFMLTDDQKRTVEEIIADLKKTIPMNRLLVGDVGSGKTVVSALAMSVALKNGFSSLLMAPTEILAQQHFTTISSLVASIGLKAHLVTGSTKKLPPTDIGVYIGTHALLTRSSDIPNIGLVVIDEQHRFGVSQRSILTNTKKGITPHLLTMTATPIPRTMTKVLFANVDMSMLSTIPTNRPKIKTWVIPKEKRNAAYQWIIDQIHKTSGQVFIICPLIEESETLMSVRAVTSELTKLQKIFSPLHIGLLHGRLKPKEKTNVLDQFRNKNIDILLSTPVVEVGIDIPNATIMVIEAAERFGLAQLHQLRGRVGRGTLQSYCLLFTEKDNESVQIRLKSLETIQNGPELAEIDLKMRGPGDLSGIRQHGLPALQFASLSDTSLISQIQEATSKLLTDDPELKNLPLLREKLKNSTIKAIIQD